MAGWRPPSAAPGRYGFPLVPPHHENGAKHQEESHTTFAAFSCSPKTTIESRMGMLVARLISSQLVEIFP